MCPGFRHKDWEGLPGFLLAFWPCSYRSGPHISHCCYIKRPQEHPKFSLLIFTFAKFPPTAERFGACKSQWAFTSASKESLPSVPAFPDIIKQKNGGAGASRQAGKALSAPHPQSVILPTTRAASRLPPLPHAPRCRHSVHTSLSARSSAGPCPATFSVLSPLSFFWSCLFRSDFSAKLGYPTPLRLGRVQPLASDFSFPTESSVHP